MRLLEIDGHVINVYKIVHIQPYRTGCLLILTDSQIEFPQLTPRKLAERINGAL